MPRVTMNDIRGKSDGRSLVPTMEETARELEERINWAKIDTQVGYEGKKIVLPGEPGNMPLDIAIETLERVREQESQKFDVNELVKGAPWDCLVAVFKACQQIYGVVTSHTIKTWFGDINPDFVTVNTGPGKNDKLQVPTGQMRVPGVKEPFMLQINHLGAMISGTVNKADQTRLVEIANLARTILSTDSIYKGKAIVLKVDNDGNLNLNEQPDFLELSKVRETDMIHTDETQAMIETNVFSPIKNTEGCRRYGIPLKRGVLLEGRYGTGKSLTARVTAKVATDNGWTFIMLGRSQGLKSAIEFGRTYQPCVIFAEDIDRASDRSNEAVNDLVNLIDGVITKDMEVMTVLTTNFIDKIDRALLRPGRFDAVISIQEPDPQTVQRLIRAYSRGILEENVDLNQASELMAGQIPATIREMVERAKLSMLAEQRDTLSARDLYGAALSMRRHMDLLQPKAPEKPKSQVFGEAFIDLFDEALIEGLDISGQVENDGQYTREKIAEQGQGLMKRIRDTHDVAMGAANSSHKGWENTEQIKEEMGIGVGQRRRA